MSFPDYAGLTAKVDNVDTIMAADINELQDAIQEIAVRGYGTFPMAEGAAHLAPTSPTRPGAGISRSLRPAFSILGPIR